MYERIFNMKFMPPGRGLWAMGSPLTEERYKSSRPDSGLPCSPLDAILTLSVCVYY